MCQELFQDYSKKVNIYQYYHFLSVDNSIVTIRLYTNAKEEIYYPEAQSALNRFKFEVASELGVPLSEGYNGDLTSRQNGSVGGYMVKKMIEAQEKQMAER